MNMQIIDGFEISGTTITIGNVRLFVITTNIVANIEQI